MSSRAAELLTATREVHVALDRINSHKPSLNSNANIGYRKNCAAAIGQWEVLFASAEARGVVVPHYRNVNPDHAGKFSSLEQTRMLDALVCPCCHSSKTTTMRCACLPCVSPTLSSVSWESKVERLEDFSLSTVSNHSTLQSPENVFSELPDFIDELLKEDDDPYEDLGDHDDIPMSMSDCASEDESEVDENNPVNADLKLVFDPLQIPPSNIRLGRSPFANLYEREDWVDSPPSPLSAALHSIDSEVEVRQLNPERRSLPLLRSISASELVRLEHLRERAKCIDDWTWAFGEDSEGDLV